MESLETTACFGDDLLDFSSDIGEEEEDEHEHDHDVVLSAQNRRRNHRAFSLLDGCPPFHEFVEEEELEWISNKDAFPMVESFVDIIPNHPSISASNNNNNYSHHSPVSVLENSSTSSSINSSGRGSNNNGAALSAMISLLSSTFKVPGKARSKQGRRRRREMSSEHFQCWEKAKPVKAVPSKSTSTIGRKCLHCGAEKTPQWRAGPFGPKTLCNACGVRYKSGRLAPEYRPANSPTFSSELHSNSHRKVMEMRRQKLMMLGEQPGVNIG